VHYDIDSLKLPGSDDGMPGRNGGSVTALANRFVHMTDKKFLETGFGVEGVIAIINKDLDLNGIGYKNEKTGVGDIYLSPLVLGWYGERWDGVFSAGIWFDTADSSEKDSGAGASDNKFSRHAIGVEASYLSKTLGGFTEAAYYNEYQLEAGTNPGPKGDTFRLSIVRPF
jgi:hypothetical protein